MIKRISFGLIFFLSAVINLSAGLYDKGEALDLPVGETIHYDIIVDIKGELNISGKVGSLIFRLDGKGKYRGKESYRCHTFVRSLPWVDVIYTMRDYFYVWFDAYSFQPYKLEKIEKEGDWENYVTNMLYPQEGYGNYIDKRKSKRIYDIPTNAPSFDLLTLIYYLRHIEKEGKDVDLHYIEKYWTTPMHFTFKDAKPQYCYPLRKNGKVRIRRAIQKKKDTYGGFIVNMAKDYGNVPVSVIVPDFEVSGFTVTIFGKLRTYINPNDPRYKNVRKKKDDLEDEIAARNGFKKIDLLNKRPKRVRR